MRTFRPIGPRAWLGGLLILSVGLRGAYVGAHAHLLADDPDHYARLANNLVRHGMFSFTPELAVPTAYRPVLYPLLLAGLVPLFGEALWPVALVQIALGAATVGLVWHVARSLAGSTAAAAAGLAAALDPLLVHATALRMTEAASALLMILGLWAVLRIAPGHPGRDALLAGVLLGLGALCRPIVWAWAVLVGVAWKFRPAMDLRPKLVALLALGAGFVAVQTPWLVRNWLALGRPIWTTTHGGYTFALGNNPVLYREVVANPHQDVWPEASLIAWQRDLALACGFGDEVDRDACLYSLGWRFIREHPGAFAACAWFKLRQFWALKPHAMYDPVGRRLVTVWYAVRLPLLVAGLVVGRCWRWPLVLPLLAILAFSLTHTFYWSDMRMRTPVEPFLALFVGVGVAWLPSRFRL